MEAVRVCAEHRLALDVTASDELRCPAGHGFGGWGRVQVVHPWLVVDGTKGSVLAAATFAEVSLGAELADIASHLVDPPARTVATGRPARAAA
jgi:hypothetical protein